jgi:hypothetical protein
LLFLGGRPLLSICLILLSKTNLSFLVANPDLRIQSLFSCSI